MKFIEPLAGFWEIKTYRPTRNELNVHCALTQINKNNSISLYAQHFVATQRIERMLGY